MSFWFLISVVQYPRQIPIFGARTVCKKKINYGRTKFGLKVQISSEITSVGVITKLLVSVFLRSLTLTCTFYSMCCNEYIKKLPLEFLNVSIIKVSKTLYRVSAELHSEEIKQTNETCFRDPKNWSPVSHLVRCDKNGLKIEYWKNILKILHACPWSTDLNQVNSWAKFDRFKSLFLSNAQRLYEGTVIAKVCF